MSILKPMTYLGNRRLSERYPQWNRSEAVFFGAIRAAGAHRLSGRRGNSIGLFLERRAVVCALYY
jgi:hypothetical protein